MAHDLQHAAMTLERDLRNPKVVLQHLQLLHAMLEVLARDEDVDHTAAMALASPRGGGKANVEEAEQPGPVRFNPFLPVQDASVSRLISAETLGLPPLSSQAAKELARLFEEAGSKDAATLPTAGSTAGTGAALSLIHI